MRGKLGIEEFLGALGADGRLDERRQAAALVPGAHAVQRLVERQARIAGRQHRVGPAGEPAGGPRPVRTEALRRAPGPGASPVASVRSPAARQRRQLGYDAAAAPGRCRRYDLARDEGGFSDPDTLTRPPRDISTPSSHDVRTPTVSVNFWRPSHRCRSTGGRRRVFPRQLRLCGLRGVLRQRIPQLGAPLVFGSVLRTEILGAGIDDTALPRARRRGLMAARQRPIEEERQRDLRHRAALCGLEGQGVHRGVPGRLHL